MRLAAPGTDTPLGAHYENGRTNFAIFSENATRVELCLFDESNREERLELVDRDGHIWHGMVPVAPGQQYGFRVHGVWDPPSGMRYNGAKLLLDPYARAISGTLKWGDPLYGYRRKEGGEGTQPASGSSLPPPSDLAPDYSDSAPFTLRSVVVDDTFDWQSDRHPEIPWADTIIYETHVKGFTRRMPEVPEPLQGTYAGLCHPAAISHLLRLGITTIELMPVHQFIDTERLVELGLHNYWGYNSVGYFAPENRYSSCGDKGGQVREFQEMVRSLHAAGLEVILDVVYNHTGEGGRFGPNLVFRGIDNPSYYRLEDNNPAAYWDVTGCGNTLNVRHPETLRLIMDSLRYWVTEMHVDGFRFDLASALARQFYEVDRLSTFFETIHQDPTLSRVKLIAEPWDLGSGGYQVGNFPVRWGEWNGKYRDTVRDYWRGQSHGVADLAYRLTGSSDLYEGEGRGPYASINFVTAHDGFTLSDLVSYENKYNLANGEDNRDGTNDNRSWNCGAEGDTDDPSILALRKRQKRNLLTTLLVSQGCPMLLSGDELGRTQHGNNNAYCQDGELSWLDWEHADSELLEFTSRLIQLRRDQPVLRRRHFFKGQVGARQNRKDITWYRRDGQEMQESDWDDSAHRSIGFLLNGSLIPDRDDLGRPIVGDSLLILMHASPDDSEWTLPAASGAAWELLLDTAQDNTYTATPENEKVHPGREKITVTAHSMLIFRRIY